MLGDIGLMNMTLASPDQFGPDQSPKTQLPVYVIAFADATERRKIMRERLNRLDLAPLDLKCIFIDAVDGRAMSGAERDALLSPQRRHWLPREISPGALGCSLSHIASWRQFLASDAECALILEDDAEFLAGAGPVIAQLAKQADRFDIITLSVCKPKPCHHLADLPEAHYLTAPRYTQIGAAAYLISRHAAGKALAQATPIIFEIDLYINRWWQYGLSNLLVQPPIAREDGRTSTIGYKQQPPRWSDDDIWLRLRRRYLRVQDSLQKRLGFWAYIRANRKKWRA